MKIDNTMLYAKYVNIFSWLMAELILILFNNLPMRFLVDIFSLYYKGFIDISIIYL